MAEGATGNYFDMYILIANPTSIDAIVDAQYLLPDGTTITKRYTVPKNSRYNIWVDDQDRGNVPDRLRDTAVSATLTSLNGVGIIVERSMWWPGPTAATWQEAHNSFGSPRQPGRSGRWLRASWEDPRHRDICPRRQYVVLSGVRTGHAALRGRRVASEDLSAAREQPRERGCPSGGFRRRPTGAASE